MLEKYLFEKKKYWKGSHGGTTKLFLVPASGLQLV